MVLGRRLLIQKLGEKIRKMDQTTVAEVKSYTSPPAAAVNIMKASLLLLGQPKQDIKVLISNGIVAKIKVP